MSLKTSLQMHLGKTSSQGPMQRTALGGAWARNADKCKSMSNTRSLSPSLPLLSEAEMHNMSIQMAEEFCLIHVMAMNARQNHDSPHLVILICQFCINIFFTVLSTKSLTELARTHLWVSTLHPHCLCLSESLAYSR